MVKQKKALLISSVLFLFVFCLVGIPFTYWWFNGDDFSAIALAVHAKGWRAIFDCFLNGNIWQYFFPSHHQLFCLPNHQPPERYSCFSFYYRPLYCLYFIIGYWLWGLSGYFFFLANAFFHALNTVILFNIFSYFVTLVPALLGALFFAFHPQIGFRYGSIANLHYYIDLSLIFFCFLSLKRFLDSKRFAWLLISCFLFLLSLFTRETSIIVPVVAIGFAFFYKYCNEFSLWKNVINFFVQYGRLLLGYFFCVAFYMSLRLYLYPLKTAGPQSHFIDYIVAWLHRLPQRKQEFLVSVYDFLGLSWLPWGVIWLKALLILPLLLIFAWLFIRNTQKKWVLFWMLAFLLILWPSLYICYSPRYFYEAYPFALLGFVFLFAFARVNIIVKTMTTFFIGVLCFVNIVFTMQNLTCRETKLNTIKQAIFSLAQDQRVAEGKRPLCFLAFPADGFGTGIEQAVWLFATPYDNSVYYDPSTILVQGDANVLEHAGWYMRCAPLYTENYFTVKRTNNTIRFTSTNPHKINFPMPDDYLSLGQKTIHQTVVINGVTVVTDFTLTLDEKYANQNPLIITWDFEKHSFVIQE